MKNSSPIMPTTSRHPKHRVKAFVERKFGVTISRAPLFPPNKHPDAALRKIRRWSSNDIIFDVGANDGRTIRRVQHQLNSPRILAFEPVSSTYQVLVDRTSQYENVSTFQMALGAKQREATIYLNEIAEMNSLSPEWGSPIGTEVVEVSTVDAVMKEQGIQFIHLLKIDTEGHDLEVLKGAQEALSSGRIAIVQVEVGFDQLEKDQPSLEQMRVHLAPLGYYLYGIYNQCRKRVSASESWTAGESNGFRPAVLAYCDAVFVHATQ